MNKKNKHLWGGRFETKMSNIMTAVGQSIDYDKKLYAEDIIGSMAHVKMLAQCKIISQKEKSEICQGLKKIYKEIEKGEFTFKHELEDIHMHIENRLIELIGDSGKKMHTARSRNDQISVDVHLYLKKHAAQQMELICNVLTILLEKSKTHFELIFPGYTHMQVAQPIRLAHYFLAYFWMFARDFKNLQKAHSSADILTLGSGAFAGVNYNTDRKLLASYLNFAAISDNSMDSVSQRDYQLDYLFFASQFYTHLSRLCEEIIYFTTVEFSFFTLADDISTGSSIMPQKKNPDLAELLRGKSARVIANLNRCFILQKALPLTYNRDLQEDKELLFDSVEQTYFGIEGCAALLNGLTVNSQNIERSLKNGFATATDLADALVQQKGYHFRDAHEIVGKLVKEASKCNCTLFDLNSETRKKIDTALEDDAFYFAAIDLKKSADKKISYGGTAKNQVKIQMQNAQKQLTKFRKYIESNDLKIPSLDRF